MCSLLASATGETDRLLGAFNKKALADSIVNVTKLSELSHTKKRAIEAQLYSDFMPPLERGDIIQIASSLVCATDSVARALCEMQVWGITTSTGEAIEFSDLAHRASLKLEGLSRSLARFRRERSLIGKLGDISDTLRKREALYVDAVCSLAGRTSNAGEIIARTRIYDSLAEMCYRCECVAECTASAILKNI